MFRYSGKLEEKVGGNTGAVYSQLAIRTRLLQGNFRCLEEALCEEKDVLSQYLYFLVFLRYYFVVNLFFFESLI